MAILDITPNAASHHGKKTTYRKTNHTVRVKTTVPQTEYTRNIRKSTHWEQVLGTDNRSTI